MGIFSWSKTSESVSKVEAKIGQWCLGGRQWYFLWRSPQLSKGERLGAESTPDGLSLQSFPAGLCFLSIPPLLPPLSFIPLLCLPLPPLSLFLSCSFTPGTPSSSSSYLHLSYHFAPSCCDRVIFHPQLFWCSFSPCHLLYWILQTHARTEIMPVLFNPTT